MPSASYFPPERLPEAHARIDDGAADAGRDPAAIARVYNVFGTITGGPSDGFLQGPANQWVDELAELALDGGMDTFVFGTRATTSPSTNSSPARSCLRCGRTSRGRVGDAYA